MAEVLRTQTDSFAALLRLAEIDPARDLKYADLRNIDFKTDDLSGFDFSYADLSGANFTCSTGLEPSMFIGAIHDSGTKWPTDFQSDLIPNSKIGDPIDDWSNGHAPNWAETWGRDEYGPWVTFAVSGPSGEPISQRMRWCPPGHFMMGSPQSDEKREDDEGPLQRVFFKEGFWILESACQLRLWNAVMGESRSADRAPDFPVTDVSWNHARRFIEMLNSAVDGLALELPSEAQWEYACRTGNATVPIPILPKEALSDQPAVRHSPFAVGKMRPNRWGLHEMVGNVGEWCADTWRGTYEGKLSEELQFKLALCYVMSSKNLSATEGEGQSTRSRLPLPTRALPLAEVSKLRGQFAALALRIIHHDDNMHKTQWTNLPRMARDSFDALEQVRVEVFGARNMPTIAADLRSKLSDECEAEGYDRMTRKDQLPIEKALALLSREYLTNEQSPAAALRIITLWRSSLPHSFDRILAEMKASLADQYVYAYASIKLLEAFDIIGKNTHIIEINLEEDAKTEGQSQFIRSDTSIISEASDAGNLSGAVPARASVLMSETELPWIMNTDTVFRSVRGGWIEPLGLFQPSPRATSRLPFPSTGHSPLIGFRFVQAE